jgi:hypothetical protein
MSTKARIWLLFHRANGRRKCSHNVCRVWRVGVHCLSQPTAGTLPLSSLLQTGTCIYFWENERSLSKVQRLCCSCSKLNGVATPVKVVARRALVSRVSVIGPDGLQSDAKFAQQSSSASSCAVHGFPLAFRHRSTKSMLLSK